MSFASDLRDGIQLLNELTQEGGLQARVTYIPWVDTLDGYGTPKYDEPVEKRAIVDQSVKLRRSATGDMILTQANVLFLEQIKPNGAPKRQSEPIDTRDVIILPDGRTGPIVSIGAPVDGETNRPFYSEVLIGMA